MLFENCIILLRGNGTTNGYNPLPLQISSFQTAYPEPSYTGAKATKVVTYTYSFSNLLHKQVIDILADTIQIIIALHGKENLFVLGF